MEALAGLINNGSSVPVGTRALPAEDSADLSKLLDRLQQVLSTRVHSFTRPLPTQEAIEAGTYNGNPGGFTESFLRTIWRNHWVEPVSLRGLLTLAYQRVWSTNQQSEFRYDAKRNLLLFTEPRSELSPLLRNASRGTGALAVTSVHKHDRFVRLPIVEPTMDDRLIKVNVAYGTSAIPSVSETSDRTRGLLHAVATSLATQNVDLLRLNSTSAFEPPAEHGVIKITGLLPPKSEQHTQVTLLERSLAEALEQFGSTEPTSTVHPFPRRKIFLSIPQNACRRSDIHAKAKNVANKSGFELIDTETRIGEVTRAVVESLRDCDAMLQFYVPSCPASKRAGSPPAAGAAVKKSKRSYDFQWLWVEYGLALMRGIPVLRIFDEDIPKHVSRRLKPRADQDRPLLSISTRDVFLKELGLEITKFLLQIPVIEHTNKAEP
ncbi:MAG TPA: hypothetical protein VFS20_29435 [Longimicrobium sp.]|nr:hypothetical protein [Longimicrobium sp.]